MTIENYPDNITVKEAIQNRMKGDLDELWNLVQSATAGSGVLVSASDVVGYLIDKLVAGTGITITKKAAGGSESLQISTAAAVVTDESALGTGKVDGEVRTCAGSGNRYNWDQTNLKWRIIGCNIYASAPADTVYTIPDGTIAVIAGIVKMYTGGAWKEVGASQLPVGAIVPMPVGTVPDNYEEADGAAISRTTFAKLFAVIGTAYGDGDGSTTFNKPDLRGYTLRGWDHGAGVDPDAAGRTDRGDGTTGDAVGTKQADEFKSHNHTYYSHGVGTPDVTLAAGSDYGWHTGTGPFGTGSSGGNETRMKNVNVMYCIYTG